MPHKDKQKLKEYKDKWNKIYYKNNRTQEIERVRKRKQEIRLWLKLYKETLKCAICSENHPACLEFHHKDRKQKSFGISDAIEKRGYSKDKMLLEIKKCKVLCSNCHRKLHFK